MFASCAGLLCAGGRIAYIFSELLWGVTRSGRREVGGSFSAGQGEGDDVQEVWQHAVLIFKTVFEPLKSKRAVIREAQARAAASAEIREEAISLKEDEERLQHCSSQATVAE